ncbi:universal stress protein [Archangium violaceum]|uniref:universal stress protein n=1 Tax=Archangium violaceum TaxID=83451 RepID=UPI002B30F3E2|nr:universal stress protein [Archangium gephyra]
MMAQPIRRILVATDFSEYSRRAMQYALSLGERMGASIDLLHVWEPPQTMEAESLMLETGDPGGPLDSSGLAHAGRLLHAWAERYHSSSVPLRLQLERGSAADTILRLANTGYDLVVMGTHGRTGLARLFMGSVAQKVVARATCPVLTVHGMEEEQEALPMG